MEMYIITCEEIIAISYISGNEEIIIISCINGNVHYHMKRLLHIPYNINAYVHYHMKEFMQFLTLMECTPSHENYCNFDTVLLELYIIINEGILAFW